MPTVKITIDAEAKVTVEAQGVVGMGCTQLTAAIERELGKTTAEIKKPEYHQVQGQRAAQANSAKAGQ
jgi:tRNA A37 threonylcarbamoyladenosine biosynthesis protein TsaE